MMQYEILMKCGEKIRVDMTDTSPCLIKKFADAARVNIAGLVMTFDEFLCVRCDDVSAIRKLPTSR